MTLKTYLFAAAIMLLCIPTLSCKKTATTGTASLSATEIHIPQTGNTYVTQCDHEGSFAQSASEIIDTYTGNITRWDSTRTIISLFVNTGATGDLTLWTTATAGAPDMKSTLEISLGQQKKKINITGGTPTQYEVGTFRIDAPGYQEFKIKGISKTGATFGNITGFKAGGTAIEGKNHYVPSDKVSDCYWFRRGPSVHMMYELPAENIEYFYNEAIVPEGHDVDGTYFMLTGFGEGYMGIQAIRGENGENENLVLFSVWSPYDTDNPDKIPASLHVSPLAKGADVTVQDFGNEGSGKQSFMRYPWQTGKTYRTLVKVKPDGNGNTIYTGYFCDEKGNWHLLSQLKRPKTDTYYANPHSFLECFKPETSIHTRSVIFKNQWARDKNGQWHEVVNGTFTCDNTGISGMRTDLKGGIRDNGFLLQNCGFFNETTPYGSKFHREPTGNIPDIDFEALNRLTE